MFSLSIYLVVVSVVYIAHTSQGNCITAVLFSFVSRAFGSVQIEYLHSTRTMCEPYACINLQSRSAPIGVVSVVVVHVA